MILEKINVNKLAILAFFSGILDINGPGYSAGEDISEIEDIEGKIRLDLLTN